MFSKLIVVALACAAAAEAEVTLSFAPSLLLDAPAPVRAPPVPAVPAPVPDLMATPSLPLSPKAGPCARAVGPGVGAFEAAALLGTEAGCMDFRKLEEVDELFVVDALRVAGATPFAAAAAAAAVGGGAAAAATVAVGAAACAGALPPTLRWRVVLSLWKKRQSSPWSLAWCEEYVGLS